MLSEKENIIYENLRLIEQDKKRITELQERLSEITYRVTPVYSLSAGNGGVKINQIERIVERKIEIQEELKSLNEKIKAYNNALQNAGLTSKEIAIIEAVIKGYKLTEYAALAGIYKSSVYKIRDKAIHKIARLI